MALLRSVGVRLSFALALVVAGALAIVWIALVPTLQRRLEDGKLDRLASSARAVTRDAEATGGVDQDFVDDAARTASARVVYFSAPLGGGGQMALIPQYDSQRLRPAGDVVNDPIALRASTSGKPTRGFVERGGQSFAEAAVPDANGDVLLLSSSLADVRANVELVRQRVAWAGLVALAVSLLVGFGAAIAFGRRIRRLERAAERIASGDFSEPVVDRGRDEIGELAAAFDRMRRQLAQLDDARRAFIANASHELRTPIFSLAGFLELLRDEELDEATRDEFFATMSEQVERLAKLAAELLDLSRIDAGQLRPEREPVELAPVASALCGEFAAVARRRGHPLELDADGAGLAVGDSERLLQIGRALVENALLHTPPGTPVRVVARGSTLAVEDAGPGIPEADQERVFARFTRLHGGRASGTGLGLAIARELAELMDGRLVLESEPGRTVFRLELPAAEAPGLEEALRLHEEARPPFSRGNGTGGLGAATGG
ncbi:MAG: HAMP domain-containing protein [Thermoleophilia bacterium]|nr:HAMP domain-containing protein [Thermoleophilia bacterium]